MNDIRDELRRAGDLVSPPEDPFEKLTRRRDRRRRRERLMAGGVAMILAVGVLGGTLVVLGRAGFHGSGNPAAGGNASHVKQDQRADHLALADGQYLYVRWTNNEVGFVQQTWWGTDGSGKVTDDCTVPDCTANWGFGPQGVFGPGEFPTDDDLAGLSTDPTELFAQLLARTAPGGRSPEPPVSPGPELTPGVTAGGLLYAIDNLLQDPNGTPELKAALFEVALGIEGVTVKKGMTDPAGRPAVVLEFGYGAGSGEPNDYYFDPATRLLMAIAPVGDPGNSALYDQGIVTSTDAVPAGDQWLFPEAPRT
jgi:hypothetical protein